MTVFFADDDFDDRAIFCEAVVEVDSTINCFVYENGLEVIEAISKTAVLPDLIFLDINMHGMNGWECLIALKGNDYTKHLPVIMYSTSNSKTDVTKAIELGAVCVITKPASYKEIKGILKIIFSNIKGDLVEHLKKFR
jgi:CheY-like chemotaxis protein